MNEPSNKARECLFLAAAAYDGASAPLLMKALRIAYDVGYSEGRLAGGIEMRDVIGEQLHTVSA